MDKKLNISKYLSSLFIIIGGLLVWNALTEILIFDKKIVIIIGIISFLFGYLFLIKEYIVIGKNVSLQIALKIMADKWVLQIK